VIDATGLGPDEIAGLKLLVVDQQLAVKQMQFFDACMAMWRVVRSWREPHKHRNAARLRIDSNQFAE
jgi:ribosomal protein L32E